MEDAFSSQFSNPMMSQNTYITPAMMADYGRYMYSTHPIPKEFEDRKEPICQRVLVNEHGTPVSPIINKMEEEDMTEKKNFGLKDATLVLIIGWILSKLVNRWTGKTFDEFIAEYKDDFKAWLEK